LVRRISGPASRLLVASTVPVGEDEAIDSVLGRLNIATRPTPIRVARRQRLLYGDSNPHDLAGRLVALPRMR
jgi:hypothetical protein